MRKVYASSSEYEVYGENVDCTLKVSTKIDGWEFLRVNCSAERQIVLQHGDGMCITGVRGDMVLRFSNYALERSQEVVFSPVTEMVFMDLSKLKEENVVSIKEASRKEGGISLRFNWIDTENTGGT